ncbi:MAG: YhdP family phospholipid transporter [Halothiobacillus sp.]
MRPLHLPHAIHISSRPIRRLLRGILVLVAMLLVVLALMFTALRLALPYMNDYRQNVQTLLSQMWGSPVTFAQIDITFVGYHPQLILKDVHLGADGPVIGQIGASLALWRSVFQGRWVAGKIVIDRPQLQFNLQPDGQWHLAGAPQNSETQSADSWSQWLDHLPDLGDVSVQDAHISWVRQSEALTRQPARSLSVTLSATARLAAHGWSMSGELIAPDFGAQPVRVRAQGRLGKEFATELYINTRSWRLPAMQQAIRDFTTGSIRAELGGCAEQMSGIDCAAGLPVFNRGQLTGELWLRFSGSDLSSVHAGFDIGDLKVSRMTKKIAGTGGATQVYNEVKPQAGNPVLTEARSEAALNRLNGQLIWQKTPLGWRLDADQVGIVTDDRERLPLQSVHLIQSGNQTYFSSDFTDLNQLSVWLAIAPLPQAYLQLLGQNSLRGQARNVRLQFIGDHLESGFLELNHFGNVPGQRLWPVIGQADGLGGLNLTLYKQPAGWLASINQQHLVLAVPGMFREPMTIDTLTGDVYWHDSATSLIYSPAITFKNADLSLNGSFRYQAADLASAQPAQLSIDTHFSQIAAVRVPAYLPRNLLDKSVLDWLDNSLGQPDQTGRVNQGQFVFNGDPTRFPFVRGGGWFSVVFDFDHLDVPYRPQWPALHNAKGHIAFVNQQFHTEIDQGTVANVPVAGARVSIFDLDNPVLDLALKTQAPLAGMLGFIQQSPLMPRGSLDPIQTTGNATLDLSVKVGFQHGGYAVTHGTLQLQNNGFILDKTPIELSQIKGTVKFNNTDFNGDALSAQFVGEPVALQVSTAKNADVTTIQAQTLLDPLFALRERTSPAFAPIVQQVSGKAMTDVSVDIPHQGNTFTVLARSDLHGVVSRLPAPFRKTAEALWPMTADLTIQAGVLRALSIDTQGRKLGNGQDSNQGAEPWQARLAFNPSGDLAQGAVSNDGSQPAASNQQANALDLSLHTPIFDWDQWQPILMSAQANSSNESKMAPFAVHLQADRVRAAGFTFPATQFDLTYIHNDYLLTAKGSALDGTGRYQLPDQTHPAGQVSLKLSRLYLNSAANVSAIKPLTDNRTEPPPITAWALNRIPDAVVSINDLQHDAHHFGKLSFSVASAQAQARVTAAAIQISPIDWQPSATVQLTGNASVVGEGVVQRSNLSLTARGNEFGSMLKNVLGTSPLQGGAIKTAQFALDWPGSPSSFAAERLSGSGQFELTQGQLNDVNPGAGRLAGLLSLGALTRRLRMDFSDVVDQGLPFDTLSAQWQLKQGSLIVAPLTLKNASLTAVVDGKTELRTNSLDYTVKIYADIGMLLPIIGTVAGGPLVGGAVLALQQAFSALNKNPAPTLTYHITGTISQPLVNTIESKSAH